MHRLGRRTNRRPREERLGETGWTVVVVVVVLAAVLGPVATLRYLAILERRKGGRRGSGD